MSEKIPSNLTNRIEHISVTEFETVSTAHIAITETLREQLQSEHTALLYHNPAHTWGENMEGNEGGVVGNVNKLLQAVHQPLLKIIDQNQPTLNRYYAWELGVVAGAAAHDVIMRSIIIENGDQQKIERTGGWQSGKNEYESFNKLKDLIEDYLPEDSQYKEVYINAAESAIKATIPNATSFVPFDKETVNDLPEIVQTSLRSTSTEGDSQYLGLRLDSQHANESLEGLLLSTADLAAARSPAIFFATGNAEFWESQLPQTLTAIQVLEATEVERTTAQTLLEACTKWRQIQVGVALWQQERLNERFTTENIQKLLAESLGLQAPDEVCEDIAKSCKDLFLSGMAESTLDAAKKYQNFVEQYQIAKTGTEILDSKERVILDQALQFMGANLTDLKAYVTTLGLN